MDKKLLSALNNVSEAIMVLSEILTDSKDKAKSSTGQALQTSDIGKQLKSLDLGIKNIQKDTKEILKNQKTIMNMSSKRDESATNEVSQYSSDPKKKKNIKVLTDSKDKAKSSTGQALQTSDIGIQKDTKEILKNQKTIMNMSSKRDESATNEVSQYSSDPKKKKNIKDGVSMILMIAVGVLAIGLAFKIIGKVDFLSVLALSMALPLVAMAFEKIAQMKDLKPREMLNVILVTVAIATAITISSYILGMVQPVGIFQLFTAVFIAGMFGAVSFGIGKLITGITKSGLTMFGVAKVAIFLPIVMIAVSAAIVGSSYLLRNVQPVGIFQLFTAVFIVAAFGVIAFGLGKLLQGIKEIKNPAQAAMIAALLPLVLIGVSAAIMGSSMLLSQVKPIGLSQFFTTLLISIAFIPISFALPFISKALEKINFGKILMLPLTIVLMSMAILGSSYILSKVKPISISLLFNVVMQSIALSIVVMALSVPAIILGRVGLPVIIDGAIAIVLISAAITVASRILSYIKPDFFYTLADAFAYFFKVMATAVSFALKIIAPALKKFIDIVGDALVRFVKNILPPIVAAVKEFFNDVVKPMMQFLVDSLPAIGKFITTIIDSIMPLVKILIDGFKSLLQQIKDILTTVGQVIEKIGNTIIGVVNAIGNGISKVITSIGDAIGGVADKISKIIDSMSGFINSIGNTITGIIDSIVGGIERLAAVGFKDLVQAGANIVTFIATVTKALKLFTSADINIDFMNSVSKMLEQFNWFIGNLNTLNSVSVVNAPLMMAKGIDRLASSISKLNTVIDSDKLSVLNKMTGGIILMSLMDPSQFESVMSAFEEKAEIFVETINKLEGEQPRSERYSPIVNPAGTEVRAGTTPKEDKMDKVIAYLEQMNMNLGSIASDARSIQDTLINKQEEAGVLSKNFR